MERPDLETLLAQRGLKITEVERRAKTGRDSLRRVLDGRRSIFRVQVRTVVRWASVSGSSLDRFVRAACQSQALRREGVERRRRTQEAIEAALRG